jgi:trehalose 6-phosphate synthase/phosphatase
MSRLIIVSNRLPFTLRESQKENGEKDIESAPSTGGLVTALAAYLDRQRSRDPEFESLWVGWPGSELCAELQPRARAVLAEQHAHPVFLSREDSDDFYYGFCNRTLWPLFHYFTSYVDYDPAFWESYVRVNRAFANAVSELVRPDDTLWIHDYQLLLLPEMLRAAHPQASIGFFLHTPFPSHELFRLLPAAWKQQLLAGILGADLIGFHAHEYTQHFLQCTLRILGRDHRLGRLSVGEQVRHVDTFPLGVDFEKFASTAEQEVVVARSQQIAANLRHVKIVLSVDRLDYTKGLSERLQGYELFLEQHAEWRGKVTFVLLVVPSRVELPRYQQLKEELDERVGELNGRFGTIEWTPIVYQYRAEEFDELVALYRAADVALITPLRDGMNLVAKEYLACKPDATGVLILSELAGAAQEVNEAILINPNHLTEIADALQQALTMTPSEQVQRNRPIRERLRKYDASSWAKEFLASLERVKMQQGELATKQLSAPIRAQLVEAHRAAQRALFLLDYDGTLVPIAARPELAAPDPELLGLLSRLSRDAKNSVFLISGRERAGLAQWFEGIDIGIIAEHGVWLREPKGRFTLTRPLSADWKEQVAPILQLFVSRVAGSFIEEKDYSMAWHYRGANAELGEQRAKELIDELTQFTANRDIQVFEGKKVVEIRNGGVSKGTAALELLRRLEPDFVLALGDDQTDEDLFRALPATATSVHVGSPFSSARYCLSEHRAVRSLLEQLAFRG